MSNNLVQVSQTFLNNAIQNGSINQAQYPWTQSAIHAIMNNDSRAGMELASNIVSSYGFNSMEEAVKAGLQNIMGNR